MVNATYELIDGYKWCKWLGAIPGAQGAENPLISGTIYCSETEVDVLWPYSKSFTWQHNFRTHTLSRSLSMALPMSLRPFENTCIQPYCCALAHHLTCSEIAFSLYSMFSTHTFYKCTFAYYLHIYLCAHPTVPRWSRVSFMCGECIVVCAHECCARLLYRRHKTKQVHIFIRKTNCTCSFSAREQDARWIRACIAFFGWWHKQAASSSHHRTIEKLVLNIHCQHAAAHEAHIISCCCIRGVVCGNNDCNFEGSTHFRRMRHNDIANAVLFRHGHCGAKQ